MFTKKQLEFLLESIKIREKILHMDLFKCNEEELLIEDRRIRNIKKIIETKIMELKHEQHTRQTT